MTNEPMLVVQLIAGFDVEGPGGGIPRFAIELCRALDRHRCDVALFGMWNYGKPAESEKIKRLREEGIQAAALSDWDKAHPYRSFLTSLRALQARLRQKPAQILHSHSEFADPAVLACKRFVGLPQVMRTVHYGFQHEWRKRPWRRVVFTNLLFPLLFDTEIGVSQTVTDNLNRRPLARLLRRKALCLYNAVNLERFTTHQVNTVEKKQSFGIPPHARLIGSMGRLSEQKGYPDFVEAAAHVLKSQPGVYFLLVGEGEDEPKLREKAAQLGITERFIFTGARRDVEDLLQCMDLFVSSSLWEGLPTVIMESMASHVPVLATDIPGTREIITHGATGWLSPVREPVLLAEAMQHLLASPGLCSGLAERAAASIHKFSIHTIVRQYEALYTRLINPRGDHE